MGSKASLKGFEKGLKPKGGSSPPLNQRFFFFWTARRYSQGPVKTLLPKPGTWPLSTPRAQTAPDHLTQGILGAQPENKPLPSPLNTQRQHHLLYHPTLTLPCNNLGEDLDFSQARHHKKSFVS